VGRDAGLPRDLYGDVMDKFGLEWMFNISLPEGWAQTH
jgi:hypothetical protein